MANIALLTPMLSLSLNEQVTGGWNYKAIIKAADLQGLSASVVTNQNWNLQKVAIGSVVFNPTLLVVTPFTFSDGTILVGTISIGDGASATTYLAAQNVQGTGATSPVAASAVYVDTARVAAAYSVATNAQLQITFNVTSAKALNTCTAGEAHIFWEVRNMNELSYPQQ